MNILLINPPNIPFSEQKLLIEPIDIITLGTYLQEFGHNIKFLDMDCKKLNSDDLIKYIETNFKPDIGEKVREKYVIRKSKEHKRKIL